MRVLFIGLGSIAKRHILNLEDLLDSEVSIDVLWSGKMRSASGDATRFIENTIISSEELAPHYDVMMCRSELAGDRVAKVNVIKDAYLTINTEMAFDVVIDLDITSLLRRVIDIENSITEYKSNSNFDPVTSVVPVRKSPYFNMVEKKYNFYRKICESIYMARQEAPEAYELKCV